MTPSWLPSLDQMKLLQWTLKPRPKHQTPKLVPRVDMTYTVNRGCNLRPEILASELRYGLRSSFPCDQVKLLVKVAALPGAEYVNRGCILRLREWL